MCDFERGLPEPSPNVLDGKAARGIQELRSHLTIALTSQPPNMHGMARIGRIVTSGRS
jgi:hypothetical protein